MITGTTDDAASNATLFDSQPFSAYQFWSVILASFAVILDGLDNQMLGIAAPALIKDWGIARSALGDVFALGFVGMGIGTLFAGWLGDRIGRRGALISGVVVFGLATFLTGFATDMTHIAILKTLAGVGLGGVPGTAAALIAELTPARHRSLAIGFGVVGTSLGGIMGGLGASLILPHLDWRWLFWLSGIIPLISVILMFALLPESPRFLASRPKRARELARVLTKMGFTPELIEAFRQSALSRDGSKAAFVPTSALFAKDLRKDSLALCLAFFSGMFMIYLMYNWAPTLLFSNGFAVATTSSGLTAFNIGGVTGAILAALAMTLFGSRFVVVGLSLIGAAVCGGLTLLPIDGAQNSDKLLLALLALGLTASAAQSSMFAIAAHAFPSGVRARAMGLFGAAGRLGAILSAFLGAVLTAHGNLAYFGVLTVLMIVNAISLASVRGHVPKLHKTSKVAV